MSQSQPSEFPSSQFNPELDNLSIFTPSNCPATPSSSQRTFNVYGPSSIQPSIQPSILSSVALSSLKRFERVGPDSKRAVLPLRRDESQRLGRLVVAD